MERFLLFDWDGCLANTLPQWYLSLESGLAEFGIEADESAIKSAFHHWEQLEKLGIDNMEAFVQVVYSQVQENLLSTKLMDGAEELLSELGDQRFNLAIVTSNSKQNVLPVLENLGLVNAFKAIVTKENVSQLKPDPEPLLLAMDQLAADSTKTWMIGDAKPDIVAGKSVGVGTVLYSPAINQEFYADLDLGCFGADHKISHLSQLLDITR